MKYGVVFWVKRKEEQIEYLCDLHCRVLEIGIDRFTELYDSAHAVLENINKELEKYNLITPPTKCNLK
jgi:hypothetical protein